MQERYNSLTSLFLDIVHTYPQRPAICDREQAYTYKELYERARQMAFALVNLHGRGGRIVCCSKKDTHSIICFWAILLSGNIPVMVDQEDGMAVNETKIKEVAPEGVVYDPAGVIKGGGALSADTGGSIEGPEICYILLTSGTTGRPKAVQVTHTGVLHYTFSIYERLGKPQRVIAAHVTTFGADLGLTSLLVALVSGGMLRILDKTEATDPATFCGIVRKEKVNFLKITPSHLTSIMSHAAIPCIRQIVLGGEKLSWEAAGTITASGICKELYNHYGPTETTVGATAFRVYTDSPFAANTGSVPIGSALGKGVCFLDLSTDGGADADTGELYIGGPGVSLGYLNNEAETQKRFVTRRIDGEELVCYRTGDICRKAGEGVFEFLYRTDRQVKVKGYRLELGEIELAIAGYPQVESVQAAVAELNGHSVLEAYVKPAGKAILSAGELRSWLNGRLPGYKIPTVFHFYHEAPFNSNGKIDMEALRAACRQISLPETAPAAGPSKEGWKELVEACWRKVLDIPHLSAEDNFFEIGGDSLLAIQLIGRLQRYGYKINITDLHRHPTYGAFLGMAPAGSLKTGRATTLQTTDSLTLSQHLFLQQREYNHDRYCQAILLETDRRLQVREIAIALNYVLDSHLQLTSRFSTSGHDRSYTGDKHTPLSLGTTIIDSRTPAIVRIQQLTRQMLDTISIEKGKLIAAHVFVDPQGRDYLYIACHHLVVDVISWHIFLDELIDVYDQTLRGGSARPTPENAVQEFHRMLAGRQAPPPGPPAPLRELYRLPQAAAHDEGEAPAVVVSLVFPNALSWTPKTDDQPVSHHLNGLLLSAFSSVLLAHYHLSAISVDIEFHGRPQEGDLPDLSRSVAWWSTTRAVNISKEAATPQDCIKTIDQASVIANRLNLYDHDLSGGDRARPDVLFNYLGHFPVAFSNTSIELAPSSFHPGPTRNGAALEEYKLYFTCRLIGDTLIVDIQGKMKGLNQVSLRRLSASFIRQLEHQLVRESPAIEFAQPYVSDSHLPTSGQPLHNVSVNFGAAMKKRTILLTGATGFLGAHLLKELLDERGVDIYCLVRGNDEAHAGRRLYELTDHYFGRLSPEQMQSIHVVRGDMASPSLGLDETTWQLLAQEVDVILHAAADVNLLKEYAELYRTNVDTLTTLLRLAGTDRAKEVHFISTLAVSGYTPDNSHRCFSEDDLSCGQLFLSDYERTKFEAERRMHGFLHAGGAGKIYRVGHIAGDSVTGKFQRNLGDNRIFQIIKGLMIAGMIPDCYNETVAFSYVDKVAKGIARSALGYIGREMTCLHMENPYSVTFHSIAMMLKKIGYQMDVTSIEKFRAVQESTSGHSVTDRKSLHLADLWIRRSMEAPRNVTYVQKRSVDVLARAGIYFPEPTLQWLNHLIRQGIEAGFFPTPAAAWWHRNGDAPIPEKVLYI